ncbi:hypothetical protein ACQCX2_03985 [Propionibacteriaceae bacterium Y1700]|uniref:hypothetical protein n=1 Tax=Microlunatus sp. Y1700 TaxID=3418487 RepID=UPI003DA6EF3D
MIMQKMITLLAAAGALAYTVAKVHLAVRGELGMPGFSAPVASYRTYDPFTGQLSNAAVGGVMTLLILALLARGLPRWLRWIVVGVNALGALMISIGVTTFALRAVGMAPGLGSPAEGPATRITLAVGTVWAVTWWAALRKPGRGTSATPRSTAPAAHQGSARQPAAAG